MDETAAVRRYYECLDDGDYDDLTDLLAPEFQHFRPDRTLEGRERFVSFMREDRPRTDTVHAVDSVFVPDEESPQDRVAAHGRVFGDDGEELFDFVDLFRFTDAGAVELRTFTA